MARQPRDEQERKRLEDKDGEERYLNLANQYFRWQKARQRLLKSQEELRSMPPATKYKN